MSDYAAISCCLEDCKKSFEDKDYLSAAVSAYWCVTYCMHGEPYGMTGKELSEAEYEAGVVLRACTKHFKSCKLSKTTFIYGTICPKLLWLYKNKYDRRKISEATRKKFNEGHIIGALAQRLFPGGIDASDVGAEQVIDMSRFSLPFNLRQQLWLNKTECYYREQTVYEAAFTYNDVFAAVDILSKGGDGHIAYEVKCGKSVTDTFLRDCALQYYVISHNCRLEDFFLVYINEEYLDEIGIPFEEMNEKNVDIERLFIKESVLSRILPLQEEIANQIETCKAILAKKEPTVEMGPQCSSPYECMFAGYCRGGDPDFADNEQGIDTVFQ